VILKNLQTILKVKEDVSEKPALSLAKTKFQDTVYSNQQIWL